MVFFPLYLQFGKYKPDWGDVPTWTAAIFALAAGIVAFFIYRVESKRDERAEQDKRDRDIAERQAQAVKVGAWIGRLSDAHPRPERRPMSMRVTADPDPVGVLVRNASDVPVYNVSITYLRQACSIPSKLEDAFSELRVAPPGTTRFLEIPDEAEVPHMSELLISIKFRDAAGVWWERDPYGKLTEVLGA